jgi:hypothetical protein
VPLVSTTLCAVSATGRNATAGFRHHRQALKAKPGREAESSSPPAALRNQGGAVAIVTGAGGAAWFGGSTLASDSIMNK